MLRANRRAQAGKENIYPVVSQHYMNHKPKYTNTRTRLVIDLLSGDPQNVEITTQDRLTITTETVVVFVSASDFFLYIYISTQGPSSK